MIWDEAREELGEWSEEAGAGGCPVNGKTGCTITLSTSEFRSRRTEYEPDVITVFLITFGSQVIWQYKMDLFPVAVRAPPPIGTRNCFRQDSGGVRVQFWSFCNTQFVPVLFTVYLLRELKAPIGHMWLDVQHHTPAGQRSAIARVAIGRRTNK